MKFVLLLLLGILRPSLGRNMPPLIGTDTVSLVTSSYHGPMDWYDANRTCVELQANLAVP